MEKRFSKTTHGKDTAVVNWPPSSTVPVGLGKPRKPVEDHLKNLTKQLQEKECQLQASNTAVALIAQQGFQAALNQAMAEGFEKGKAYQAGGGAWCNE